MADTPRIVFIVFHGGASKPGPAPASRASIEALRRIKVEESGGDCSICLEEFQVDEEVREMPCKHLFHSGCIEKWLRIHGSCPVCRYLIPAADTDETGGDEGGRRRLDGGENVSGFEAFQSVLAFTSLASFMGLMGSGREDDDVASALSSDAN